MPKTMTQKVFERHLVSGSKWAPGKTLRIKPSGVLLQDATGVTCWAQFLQLRPNAEETAVPLVVQYVDHNTLAINNRNLDDRAFLKSVCAKVGAWFSDVGNGICHQVNTERFAKPWDFWMGADSHTPTSGAHGCIAVGAGGLEVATVLYGEPFELKTPKVYGVRLSGKLPDWVEAKDVILEVLRRIGVKGGLGCVLEFFGPGARTLTLEERATICNMGAETGATTTIFPADEQTRRFLRLQGREDDFAPLSPDAGAKYDAEMQINLSALVPLAACPHSPGNVVPVRELAGTPVAQVAVGSSVNSWFTDMAKVDALWRGRKVADSITVPVTPGSRQILNLLTRLGIWGRFLEAGAVPITPMCSWCVGMGNAPPSNAVSVRTGNRNFKGRSGTVDDRVYLVSPSTAAATAVEGEIVDPRDFAKRNGIRLRRARAPKPLLDMTGITWPLPKKECARIEIRWGPNINPPGENEPLPGELSFRIALVLGDNVSTGDISPDGAETMSKRSDIPAISLDTFKNVDPTFAPRALEAKRKAEERGDSEFALAVVGHENYGEGSSREHAALCPRYLGVRAVFAKSFARIHRRNLIQHGILPVLIDEAAYEALSYQSAVAIPGLRERLASGKRELILRVVGKGCFTAHHDLGSEREDEAAILLAGGFINYLREKNRE